MPLMNCCESVPTPISDIPLFSTPMIRPPVIAPTIRPTPPCTAAPPMKAAAIASSSNRFPAPGPAEFSRPVKTRPASADSTPMLTNSQKSMQRGASDESGEEPRARLDLESHLPLLPPFADLVADEQRQGEDP